MMDELCRKAECGTVLNVPIGMVPESDTANLAIMSYDPKVYSRAEVRSKLMSMGIDLGEERRCCDPLQSRHAFRRGVIATESPHSRSQCGRNKHRGGGRAGKALNEALPHGRTAPLHGRKLPSLPRLERRSRGLRFHETARHPRSGDRRQASRPDDAARSSSEFMKKSYDILENHPVNINRAASAG